MPGEMLIEVLSGRNLVKIVKKSSKQPKCRFMITWFTTKRKMSRDCAQAPCE